MTTTKTRAQLAADYRAHQDAVKALQTKGGPDLLNLTGEEEQALTKALDDRDAVKAELDALPKVDAVKARIGQGDDYLKTPVRNVPHPAAREEETPAVKGQIDATESADDKYLRKGPWKSLGHFAYEVRRCGSEQSGYYERGTLGEWNGRIGDINAAVKALPDAVKAVTGMSELTDADGAAFVPLDISARVWERVADNQTSLMGLVDVTPVTGNGLKMVAYNDKSRTSGLYGARAYWGAEGSQGTNTKMATRDISWQLKKVTVLMPVTEELYQDSTALDARLNRVATENFAYEINRVIIGGLGTAEPLGILQAGVTGTTPRITVTAVSGQGANTIIGSNVTTMYSRRPPNSEGRLVWLYNVGIEPQLDQLNFSTTAGGTNTTAMTFMYLQPGGLRENEPPRLKGRPMIENEWCPALGTEGDLILWDPSSYGVIIKSTGINQAVSMHLRFDYGELVYRWAFRMDGKPYWDDVLTPAKGNTRAPIITLSSTRT